MNVFCEDGWKQVLNDLVAASDLARIRLFQNNHVPLLTDTAANYTEATFTGYGGFQSLAWGSAFINGSTQGEIDATEVTWTRTAGATSNTIYGVYITDAADALVYAERFDAPLSITATGDAVKYIAKVTLINQ
jgi:hypothetical protein